MTKAMIDSALNYLTEGAKKVYGNKLKEVILYGSCARGDFSDDSDVDVMILIDVPKEEILAEKKRIRPII